MVNENILKQKCDKQRANDETTHKKENEYQVWVEKFQWCFSSSFVMPIYPFLFFILSTLRFVLLTFFTVSKFRLFRRCAKTCLCRKNKWINYLKRHSTLNVNISRTNNSDVITHFNRKSGWNGSFVDGKIAGVREDYTFFFIE